MDELKEAIEISRKYCYVQSPEIAESMEILISLAEKVLAVQGDLPKKRELYDGRYQDTNDYIDQQHNELIDDCILAVAKNYWKKVNRKELCEIVEKWFIDKDSDSDALVNSIITRLERHDKNDFV